MYTIGGKSGLYHLKLQQEKTKGGQNPRKSTRCWYSISIWVSCACLISSPFFSSDLSMILSQIVPFLYWHLPRGCAENRILNVSSVSLTLGKGRVEFVPLSSLTSVNILFHSWWMRTPLPNRSCHLNARHVREMLLSAVACCRAILMQQELCSKGPVS